jgi:hypothetical protein
MTLSALKRLRSMRSGARLSIGGAAARRRLDYSLHAAVFVDRRHDDARSATPFR